MRVPWMMLLPLLLACTDPAVEGQADDILQNTNDVLGTDALEGTDVLAGIDALAGTDAVDAGPPSPHLEVTPGLLDFGLVAVGTTQTRAVLLKNTGTAPLHVTLQLLVEPPFVASDFQLQGPLTLALAPGALQTVKLSLSIAKPVKVGLAASLQIDSDDPETPQRSVPVHVGTPQAQVTVLVDGTPCPEPLSDAPFACLVDFGVQPKPLDSTKLPAKMVTVVNQGPGLLVLHGVQIQDDALGEFFLAPQSILSSNLVLSPGLSQQFLVYFNSLGAPGELATATLQFSSDFELQPTFSIPLEATRANVLECVVSLTPEILDFGTVPLGQARIRPLTVTNTGSHACLFSALSLDLCYATGLWGTPSNSCKPFSAAPYFTNLGLGAKLLNLGPGESGKLLIRFDSQTAPLEAKTEIDGLAILTYTDGLMGAAVYVPKVNPGMPTQVQSANPNLKALTGVIKPELSADTLDFEWVKVGCKSLKSSVQVQNKQALPFTVTGLKLQNCQGNFVLDTTLATGGAVIAPAQSLALTVQALPQSTGPLACTLEIQTDANRLCHLANGQTAEGCEIAADCSETGATCVGDALSLKIQGMATNSSTVSETFPPGQAKVDVLFVVHDTPSLVPIQQAFLKEFPVLLAPLPVQGSFHFGVLSSGPGAGTLKLMGLSPYTLGDSPQLQTNLTAQIGQTQVYTYFDTGLAAVEKALLGPNVASGNKSCTSDTDCGAASTCTFLPEEATGGCGGANRGFHRADADLHVVILSDAEDTSPGAVKDYVTKFNALETGSAIFTLHAIVGYQGGCVGPIGKAEEAARYLDMAYTTGGITANVCSGSYSSALKKIADAVFGRSPWFALQQQPDVNSLQVLVGGKLCPAGQAWTYDAPNQRIYVHPNGVCAVGLNDTVTVQYALPCL